LGATYTLRLLRGRAALSVLGDRGKRGPFGIEGGESGAPTQIALTLGGETYVPPMLTKDENVPFDAGDRLTVSSPGGGGFEPAADRAAAAVDADVRRGYVSESAAAVRYGREPTVAHHDRPPT
jgi:N-methylhydantoinase B